MEALGPIKASRKDIEEYIEKLEARVKELMKTDVVDETRLAQEIVIYSDKCSIEEELTRLNSHISQFNELLKASSPIDLTLSPKTRFFKFFLFLNHEPIE